MYTHLYFGVVGGNAIAGQPEWNRQLFVHINHRILMFTHQSRSSVESSRARAHNRDTSGSLNRRGIAAEMA